MKGIESRLGKGANGGYRGRRDSSRISVEIGPESPGADNRKEFFSTIASPDRPRQRSYRLEASTAGSAGTAAKDEEFRVFFEDVEPRLRHVLAAGLGPVRGREAAANALAWAWENWEKVKTMVNPAGYLYRVARSSLRRRKVPALFERPILIEPTFEPGLAEGLVRLTERQRIAVVLVHGYGWTASEVAAMIGISVSSVRTHLERGLVALRTHLAVAEHA